jgi:hypothetical protein
MDDPRAAILRRLLDKYERSTHYRGDAAIGRRVRLRLGPRSPDLPLYDIEQADAREAVHAAVRSLAEAGLVGYAWARDSLHTVLGEIWLVLDQVERVYAWLGLQPTRVVVGALIDLIDEMLAGWPADSDAGPSVGGQNRRWLIPALQHLREQLAQRGRLTAPLPDDPDLARCLLQALRAIGQADFAETYLRVFSVRCFQDSKFFERKIRSRFLTIIRANQPQICDLEADDQPGDDELLAMIGLVRNPEIYEFCGPICLDITGSRIDYGVFRRGAVLHAASVADITGVDAGRVGRLLFIENRTCYDAYIRGERRADELVVYHGGFPSPAKLLFFKLIADRVPDTAECLHWGDIDAGGLLMLLQLRRLVGPNIRAWRMDRATLLERRDLAAAWPPAYRTVLLRLLEDPACGDERAVVEAMLETGLRLEQEALIGLA